MFLTFKKENPLNHLWNVPLVFERGHCDLLKHLHFFLLRWNLVKSAVCLVMLRAACWPSRQEEQEPIAWLGDGWPLALLGCGFGVGKLYSPTSPLLYGPCISEDICSLCGANAAISQVKELHCQKNTPLPFLCFPQWGLFCTVTLLQFLMCCGAGDGLWTAWCTRVSGAMQWLCCPCPSAHAEPGQEAQLLCTSCHCGPWCSWGNTQCLCGWGSGRRRWRRKAPRGLSQWECRVRS